MLKTLLVAALVAVAVVAVRDQRVLRVTRLLGACSAVAAPAAADRVFACRSGRLSGRPDLSRKACTAQSIHGPVEYWRCPAPIAASSV